MNKKEQRKKRFKLVCLYIMSFIITILPLVVVIIYRRDFYFKSVEATVKLTIGGMILAALLGLKVIGKLKMPNRMVTYFLVLVLCYFLMPILKDIMLLVGAALLGEILDYVLFQWRIKRLKENITMTKQADIVNTQIEQTLERYLGGRV